MKLKQLKARGFWGFKRGLGVDNIDIDLRSLSGLVAITGDNGRGKTTLLELLTPYRTLASRNGNIKNHVYLRDSFKELTFDFNGSEYRTLIKIDCDSDRSEGFIFRNGESLVNGKLRDYDKKINELFGSPELFFSSVFCAQNAAKLSDLTVGQIKGLFSEFLQLDKLEAYEATAKRAGAIVAGLVAGKGRDIEKLQGPDVAIMEDDLSETESIIEDKKEIIRLVEVNMTEQAERATDARAAAAQNAVIRERAAGVRKEKEESQKVADQHAVSVNAELADLRTKCTAAIQEQQKAETLAARAGAVEDAETEAARIQTTRTILEDEIHDTEILLENITGSISGLEKEMATARQEKALAENDSAENVLAIQARTCREAMAVLENRSPKCTDPACPLIAAAVEAAERLPEIEKDIEALKAKNARRVEEMNAALFGFGSVLHKRELEKTAATEKKAAAQVKIRNGAARLALLEKDILSQRADIAAAVERKAGIETRIQELRHDGIAKKTALEIRQKDEAENMARLDTLIKDIEADMITTAEADIKNAETELAGLEKVKADTQKALAGLQATREQIAARLVEARAAESKIAALRADAQALQAEAAEWQYIQNACGNNGLRALEIDGVAPCITNNANTLLAATYGPAFSVSIRTLNDDGKECFDIVVTTDDGTETLLENLSGGQKVWILKALRLAMTLISKDKSALNYRTAFSDEEDGALDVCNAENFVNMYRAFMGAGGFDSLLYISHRPECVAMADSTINFNGAGITIN